MALPHYTGVSCTLAACDPKTVAAITEALDSIVSPKLEGEVRLIRAQNQPLLLDFDLASRRVSNTSTSYPDAQFGWQGSEVGLGYDAALVALTSPTYGRLFVAGFHYPRHPVGLSRTQQMVRAAETRLGVQPKRRTALVEKRIGALKKQIGQLKQWMATQSQKQQDLYGQSQTLGVTLAQLRAQIKSLAAKNRQAGRVETPHSPLAKARRRYEAAGKKLMKLPLAMQQAQRACATHQQRLDKLCAQQTQLVDHLHQLQADNQNNADPVPMILRMDAGFGTDALITWLIEMGYHVYTKVALKSTGTLSCTCAP